MPQRRVKYVFSVIKGYIPNRKKSRGRKEYVSQENLSRSFESRNSPLLINYIASKPRIYSLQTWIFHWGWLDWNISIKGRLSEFEIRWEQLVLPKSITASLAFCQGGDWVSWYYRTTKGWTWIWTQICLTPKLGPYREDTLKNGETYIKGRDAGIAKCTLHLLAEVLLYRGFYRQAGSWSAQHILSSQWMFINIELWYNCVTIILIVYNNIITYY